MKKTRLLTFLAAAMAATAAFAEDPSPGLWEITMESRVSGDGGWTPSPLTLTQCLTAGDAQDPSRLIGSISTPGATGCNFTERNYSGNTFRFSLDCSGSYGLKSRGSVTFGATSFTGSIAATSNLSGQPTEFVNRVSGRRIGDC